MPSEQARAVALLDELQAAERAGAEALLHWTTSCREPALRGGLRVIAARDAAHATLAEARLRALGGEPAAQASRTLVALCGVLAAPEMSDRSKLTLLLARFPSQLYDPFAELTRRIEHDDETRALLETIGDDERASLRWLREASETLPLVEDAPPSRSSDTATALDAMRAAEAAGAEVFAAWIGVAGPEALRGGLRTLAAREQVHARLLGERLREIGRAPTVALHPAVRGAALDRFGARAVADGDKVAGVLERYPAGEPPLVEDLVPLLADDPETREMVRLIAAGETGTIAWLRAYQGALGSGRADASSA